MDETNKGLKSDEAKPIVPVSGEPKVTPSVGETKQMPWTDASKQVPKQEEVKPVPPKVEEPKPTPKSVESKPIPMPAPKQEEIKKVPMSVTRKVIKLSKKKLYIGSAIVVVVILLILVGLSMSTKSARSKSWSVGQPLMMNSIAPEATNSLGGDSYFQKSPQYYNDQPSITDTREFMKINYSANIVSRKVEDTVNSIQNIVKGSDGRIDGINSSKKNGYIRFVVPQSKFDAFKSQMESLTNKKLYTENISSQNLLSQKQGIEKQTDSIANTLVNLNAQKATLDAKHTQTVNFINTEITRIRGELTGIRTAIAGATNNQALTVLRDRESSYTKQEAQQLQLLNNENSVYAIKSQNLENMISGGNNGLTIMNETDSQFTDNIETVNGYVSVNWASLWKMTRILSPIPPTVIVIVLLAIVAFCLKRYNYIPKVELE
jgi:hypothetical protein